MSRSLQSRGTCDEGSARSIDATCERQLHHRPVLRAKRRFVLILVHAPLPAGHCTDGNAALELQVGRVDMLLRRLRPFVYLFTSGKYISELFSCVQPLLSCT